MKYANIIAHAIVVGCPYCGEAQPDQQYGSLVWTSDQLQAANGTRWRCICGQTFIVRANKMARLD